MSKTNPERVVGFFLPLLIVSVLIMSWPAAIAASPRGPLEKAHWTVIGHKHLGSGFVVANGTVATNAHVLAGTSVGDAVTLVSSRSTGRRVRGILRAVSMRVDLAIIDVSQTTHSAMPISTDRMRPGARLYAFGASLRFGRSRILKAVGHVTRVPAEVGAYGRGLFAQFDAVQPGFSGGPVFDQNGNLVGMMTAMSLTPATSGLGHETFVISADALLSETQQLLAPHPEASG